MHPDVETYFASAAAYRKAYDDACHKANEANIDGDNYALRDARVRVASATRSLALLETWAELKKSEDPLIAFIGRECGGHTSYAEEILKVLPAPMETLRQIASEKDWCSDWDGFVAKARREGVIEPMSVDESIVELLEPLRIRYGIYRSEIREFEQNLKGIIEQARQEGVNSVTVSE